MTSPYPGWHLAPASAPSRPLAHHRPLCIQRRSSLACSPRQTWLFGGNNQQTRDSQSQPCFFDFKDKNASRSSSFRMMCLDHVTAKSLSCAFSILLSCCRVFVALPDYVWKSRGRFCPKDTIQARSGAILHYVCLSGSNSHQIAAHLQS